MGKILFIIIITFLLIILAFGLYALIAGWNTMQGKKGREEDLEYWRLKSYGKKYGLIILLTEVKDSSEDLRDKNCLFYSNYKRITLQYK